MKQAYQWVPTTYILQGLPFALVASVSMILYKNFNISNTQITFYTSLFTLPWFLKPLISPMFEGLISKRAIILLTSIAFVIWILLLAICIQTQYFFSLSIIIFSCIAITSTIYDMNIDGFYITNLNSKDQAHFIGIRTLSYHIGRLIAQGGVVYFASLFFISHNIIFGWQFAFVLLAFLLLLFLIYHFYSLPKEQISKKHHHALLNFKYVLIELLNLPNLTHLILFTIIYHLTENQLIKIVPLFLLDNPNHGGLNLSTSDVSILIGFLGVLGMIVGVLISGFLLTKILLRNILIPVTIFTYLTNLSYLLLSLFSYHSFFIVSVAIIFSQLGFGISNGAYMYYLLHTFGKSNYSMSLYAAGTALMGFSVILGGAISGYMQFLLGYSGFFSWILISGVMITLYCFYLIKQDIISN